jgi:hypothetical protein
MSPDFMRTLVQFRHPKKLAQAIPGGEQLPDAAIANLFGISLENFIAVQNDLQASVFKAAFFTGRWFASKFSWANRNC